MADTLAEKYGHKVLRLPPYHCTFNAIENVWGIAKGYYNDNIGKYGGGTENVLRLWQDALEHITPEMWSNCIDHVEKIIEDWWKREVGFDRNEMTEFIINLDTSASESDSLFMEDSD